MIGLYIVIGILITALLLAIIAAISPRTKHLKFRSPVVKVQPKKRRIKPKSKKKKKSVWVKIM